MNHARRVMSLTVLLNAAIVAGWSFGFIVGQAPHATPESVAPDAALARLKAGNQRFVSGQLRHKDFAVERAALTHGQHPYAIVLSCSDSRVPPEEIFDESLGKLFVVRVAGNVADPVVLGSVEYAAEHLGVRLLLVLGHESCGAIQATVDGGHFTPNIKTLVKKIQPAVAKVKDRKLDAAGTLSSAVEENVRLQIGKAISESGVLKEMVEKKKLQIVGGVYHLQTGTVDILVSPAAHN